jgi:hypothetical protein
MMMMMMVSTRRRRFGGERDSEVSMLIFHTTNIRKKSALKVGKK